MASKSEVGHAKNVANFEHLISFCTAYGSTYNPFKSNIKIPALQLLLLDAQNAIADVTTQTIAYNNSVNLRMALFEPLKKLSTRLIGALNATDATIETVKDARAIHKKIQGQRATAIKAAPTNPSNTTPAPNTISTSQQSYDQLTEHFSKFIALLSTESSYAPNEIDLQIITLTNKLKDLHSANTVVGNAYTAVSNSRIARNEVLYNETNGLSHIAQEVKNYVKSIFGTSSPQYKQVSKLRFTIA